jgi:transcription antitermination factor NusG
MPILKHEPDLYPATLLADYLAGDRAASDEANGVWWAMYTRSRREKQLMRHLLANKIPFYCPLLSRRYRSPAGRIRESFQPLFTNYVFVLGDADQRVSALTSNCVSKCVEVSDGNRLARDLEQIQRLIATGAALTPEARLLPGDPVRVKTGMFAGFEGLIVRRENQTRLMVSVNFMEQGASVLLDDCQLEKR